MWRIVYGISLMRYILGVNAHCNYIHNPYNGELLCDFLIASLDDAVVCACVGGNVLVKELILSLDS